MRSYVAGGLEQPPVIALASVQTRERRGKYSPMFGPTASNIFQVLALILDCDSSLLDLMKHGVFDIVQ